MALPIIIDCDTGIDDAMALIFAFGHPGLDVRAVSCASGNVSLDKVVANTCQMLDLVGAPDIPVAGGATQPLVRSRLDAEHVHGPSGIGDVTLPASERRIEPGHSVEAMARVLIDTPEPVTLVGLAPLTNIALLLLVHPELHAKIEKIWFMGGSASVGNATPVAEFNAWHDPEALAVVLRSGLPCTMYGLDVFDRVDLNPTQLDRLDITRVGRVVRQLLDFHLPDAEPYRLIGDAGAVAALADPGLVEWQRWPVNVDTSDGPGRGQTIVDRRGLPSGDTVVNVAMTVNKDRMAEMFVRTVMDIE